MTSPTMSDGSASVPITTPPALPSMRSADGGGRWEGPPSHTADDFRRRWRQQRIPCASLESRASETGRRAQASHNGLPLAARHQQVEQDRASPVFVHHYQLARQAVAQLSHDRPFDRRDRDRFRPHGSRRTGRKHISQRRQSLRCATGRCQSFLPLLPRRLELHDLAYSTKTVTSETELTGLFMDGP